MRNTIISAATIVACTLVSFETTIAQSTAKGGKKPAFGLGSATVGISAGFGLDYDYRRDARPFPALAVYYDRGIIGNVGPGTIGIGGMAGVKTASYDYSGGRYKASWINYILAFRATYHLTILKNKNNKFDPYAGVTIGARFAEYRDDYNAGSVQSIRRTNVHPVLGAFIGAKYNFSSRVGVFTELGYDISLVRFGLNFNNGR
jgi:hypothetical protein